MRILSQKRLLPLIGILIFLFSAVAAPQQSEVEKRIDALLAQMTLEEKAGTMFINGATINDDGSIEDKPGARGFGRSAVKQVSEQQDLLQSGAMVASRAGIPGEPEFPKPGLMTAAGFTVSLALGTVLAFLVEFLDSGMRTGRQVERALGVPA